MPVFNFSSTLHIFGKREIRYVIRAAKQDSWRCKKAERKIIGRDIFIFLRAQDKVGNCDGIWGLQCPEVLRTRIQVLHNKEHVELAGLPRPLVSVIRDALMPGRRRDESQQIQQ